MSVVPSRADGLDPDENPATLIVDGEIEEQHRRAILRVARWRAAAIAERIFGVPLDHRVIGAGSAAGFRGMLEFDVVFDRLDAHVERESAFVHAVRRDPLLGSLPLVYLFTPVPASDVGTGKGAVSRAG